MFKLRSERSETPPVCKNPQQKLESRSTPSKNMALCNFVSFELGSKSWKNWKYGTSQCRHLVSGTIDNTREPSRAPKQGRPVSSIHCFLCHSKHSQNLHNLECIKRELPKIDTPVLAIFGEILILRKDRYSYLDHVVLYFSVT